MLFIDTETTGLSEQDKIVQIAWIVVPNFKNFEENYKHDHIVKVDIPITNSHIHGITDEISQKGKELKYVLDLIIKDIEDFSIKLIIGHNINYDRNMIINNAIMIDYDTSLLSLFKQIPIYCTMMNGRYLFNKHKYPKLQELYKLFNNREFENSHNALYDVEATMNCFQKLIDKQDEIINIVWNKIINFGKYKNKTYKYIYEHDKQYLTHFIYKKIERNKDIWKDIDFLLHTEIKSNFIYNK